MAFKLSKENKQHRRLCRIAKESKRRGRLISGPRMDNGGAPKGTMFAGALYPRAKRRNKARANHALHAWKSNALRVALKHGQHYVHYPLA